MSANLALLPIDLVERRLSDLNVGNWSWTVPWMLRVGLDLTLTIIDAPIHGGRQLDKPSGTAELRVTRLTEGYRVEDYSTRRYRPSEQSHVVGHNPEEDLPVVEYVRVRAVTQ